ncbi:MAG: DNA gyrase inhibitor YacG [Natronohydrobacter sp.]|nr:DNA gyrase inhibitor YacG [Natronohydrobacter sp.]
MNCPICRKPSVKDYRPFCSKRCADVDLARWFREDYTIPTPLTGLEDDPDSLPGGEDDR